MQPGTVRRCMLGTMHYDEPVIPEAAVPATVSPVFQHAVDTYASEINKVASVWRGFSDADLGWRPHAKSSTVLEILKHELLSQRRFYGEFLGAAEPPPSEVLPREQTVEAFVRRLAEMARARLAFLAAQQPEWWLGDAVFFDVTRQRVWIFWRRVLHTAHHRTQLSVYLRLLGKPVPSTYGPTADVSWSGADPTTSVDAAARK
jgi:uncharacterized damage-inducible protein DinB